MQSLLSFRHAPTGVHERRVEEVGMSVVQLAADPRQRAGREGPKRLLFTSGNIAEDTDVLREDVLACADDGDRRGLELLLTPLRVRTLTADRVLLKLGEDVADLKTLLEVVVLICVYELQVLAAVEYERVVLVVRFAVAENRVSGKLDAELGLAPACLRIELGVTVDEGRVETWFAAVLARLFLEVRNLKFRVRAQ